MYELIKIENTTIGDESVLTVSARELHEFLEVKTKFATWISNRIDKYEFVENTDFTTISKNLENGGRLVEYHISIDMAKELAMVENNEKGREARRYFIECEKEYKKTVENYIPKTLPDALEAYALELRKHEETKLLLKQALPKVSYYDNVLNSPDLVTITQIAKDYGMTAVDFNKLLESLHIQYKQSGQWLLYHNYAKEGYTQSSTFVTEYGNSKLNTKWTQKGRLFIYEVLKDKGILPICERSLE